jgi:hypothetical protein
MACGSASSTNASNKVPRLPRVLAALGLALASAGASAAVTRDEPVRLTLASGRVIVATLRLPAADAQRRPAILLFGGFKRAAQVLDLIRTDVPVILGSFDYPFDPPRKFVFPDSLAYVPQLRAALRETFEGIALLKAHLEQRPDVDASRITIVGASLGAPFATIAGARERFPGTILVQGFGQLTRVAARQMERKWEKRYGRASALLAWPLAWLGVRLLGAPAPEEAAVAFRADQKVLLVTASADDFVPKPASEALWVALEQSSAQRERLDLPGAHLQPGADALIADILARALDWMGRNQLL